MSEVRRDADELSTKDHWDDAWRHVRLPKTIDPHDAVLSDYHVMFSKILSVDGRPSDVLEIGCAASAWLPYFKLQHRCRVFGIDYSARGVELARKNLAMLDANGDVRLGDVMTDTAIFDRQFDVVVSFGLVEHFRHPDRILRRMADYLKPGGLLVTQVPNLRGLFGTALRWFRADVFAIHHPMDLGDLQRYHELAGLIRCLVPGYVGGVDLKMIVSTVMPKRWPRLVVAGTATAVHYANPLAVRIAKLAPGPVVRYVAPDIVVVYRRPLLSARGGS